jgi:hypothetical protein
MRFRSLPCLLFPVPCLLICLAQPPAITATAKSDKTTVRLSASIRVTLTVEGPAPLRVEVPKHLLVPESDRDWKVQAVGSPAVTPAGAGRERWEHVYRLDPFADKTLRVEFAPLKVNGREVKPDGFNVEVTTTAEAKEETARPVTPIEELPPPPPPTTSSLVWWWVASTLLMVVVAAVAWRVRRQPKPVPPREWAGAAFDRLEQNTAGAALVEGVAAVVRGFIDRRFGIPATKLTTAELLAAAEQAGWPVEQTDPLRLLLDDCDRAKFAGDVPDDDGCRDLLARGREWVNLVSPDPRPG